MSEVHLYLENIGARWELDLEQGGDSPIAPKAGLSHDLTAENRPGDYA